MKSGAILSVVLAGALLSVAACQQAEAPRPDSPAAVRPESPPPGSPARSPDLSELVISGDLRRVNPEERTFILMAGNQEHRFTYSDATLVTGAAGTQGLAGREGARVTVHYRDTPDAKVALRIMLE
jgi:hypothetical protein